MGMQNYAKFESRVEDGMNVSQNSLNDMQSYTSYSGSSYDWYSTIGNTLDFLASIFFALLFFLGFFYGIYIFISLLTKGGEKTAEEIKMLLTYLSKSLVAGSKWIWKGLQALWKFVLKRKLISFGLIVVLIALGFVSSVIDGTSSLLRLTKIADSYVGVDLRNKRILDSGYVLYSPIFTNYFLSPTNNFDFEIAEVTANTSEELSVTLDYRVGYKIIPSKRLTFYETYGAKDIKIISSDIVMPRLLETIKSIIKTYSFKDISANHSEIKAKSIAEANKILNPIGIDLQELNILDIRLPESYIKSKQDLLNAENELKLAEAKLKTQEKESERQLSEAQSNEKVKVIEAEGTAKANEIIGTQRITDEMVRMKELEIEEKKIEKWNGELPASVGKDYDFIK